MATLKMSSDLHWQVYADRAGKKRWRLVSGHNGKILAESGQGYASEANCIEAIRMLSKTIAPGMRIERFPRPDMKS